MFLQPLTPFLPNTLLGWLEVFIVYLVGGVGVVFTVWRWLMKPVYARIDALVERRDELIKAETKERERCCADLEAVGIRAATAMQTALGRVEILERFMERADIDRETIHHDLGALESSIKQLVDVTRKSEVDRLKELGDIKERLVRIETKVDGRLPER